MLTPPSAFCRPRRNAFMSSLPMSECREPMDGLMLAHHTRRNWPWIDLVVTSGFVAGGLEQLPADTQFFRKPYELAAIAEHIRRTRKPN